MAANVRRRLQTLTGEAGNAGIGRWSSRRTADPSASPAWGEGGRAKATSVRAGVPREFVARDPRFRLRRLPLSASGEDKLAQCLQYRRHDRRLPVARRRVQSAIALAAHPRPASISIICSARPSSKAGSTPARARRNVVRARAVPVHRTKLARGRQEAWRRAWPGLGRRQHPAAPNGRYTVGDAATRQAILDASQRSRRRQPDGGRTRRRQQGVARGIARPRRDRHRPLHGTFPRPGRRDASS